MRPKYGQSEPDTILRAQKGDQAAQAQVLQENSGLIHKILSQRGITPYTVGNEQYRDFIGDIELQILRMTLPGYSPEKDASWSTFLYQSVNNYITDITSKKYYQEKERGYEGTVGYEAPVGEEGRPVSEIIPDISTTGISPQVELMLESAKQQLSPTDQMILDYKVMGYTGKQIAEYFQQEGMATPRGGNYTQYDVNWRWTNVIKPLLEQAFPPEMRMERGPLPKVPPGESPWQPSPSPAYHVDPGTGERTLIQESGPIYSRKKLSLRKTSVVDVLDYIRIHLLDD